MFTLHPQLQKDCHPVTDLELSRVLLMDDSQYPWLILVPMREGIREVIDLTLPDQQQLWQESAQVSRALQQCFEADKLNVAALGNMVPQLHVHHIARFTTDPAWPKPVWGHAAPEPYTREALDKRLTLLKQAL